MSHPYPSYVISPNPKKDADHPDEPNFVVGHCMSGPMMSNSHGTICKNLGLPEDRVLKVEMWNPDLISGTEPTPWAIDRLPCGIGYIEDCPQEMQDLAEAAAQAFMTPDNIRAYLTVNKDGGHLAEAILTQDYIDRWMTAAPRPENLPLSHTRELERALCYLSGTFGPKDSTFISSIASSASPRGMAPEIHLADILNPAVWSVLPAN